MGKIENGVLTKFLYDGWQVVQETATSSPSVNYLTGLGLDEVLRRRQNGEVRDFAVDALGSTIALLDIVGAVKTSYRYDVYGNTSTAGEVSSNTLQYTGRENDGAGLYYYRNRYYNSVHGRFVSEDPLGLLAGSNLYAYVDGDPVGYNDPLGLATTKLVDRRGGRSAFLGPTNGNWGGKCWSGGQYSCGPEGPGRAPPVDSGDVCYKNHDTCYVRCAHNKACEKICDGTLIKELNALDYDPRKWPQPPPKGTEGDSRGFKGDARAYF